MVQVIFFELEICFFPATSGDGSVSVRERVIGWVKEDAGCDLGSFPPVLQCHTNTQLKQIMFTVYLKLQICALILLNLHPHSYDHNL